MNRMRRARSLSSLPGSWALGVLLIAHVLLALGKEPAVTWFYPIVWWCYILIVDTIVFVRRGTSLILSSPGEFVKIAALSVPVWLFFELINFTIKNWYYAGASPVLAYRVAGQIVSFATVLPLLLVTADALATTDLFSSRQGRPRSMGRILPAVISVAGLTMLALSFYKPGVFFPLVWASLFFALEPINRRYGAPSLLRDIEQGRPRRFLLLLSAGLLAGVLWEAWNYGAEAKWVYTIPGVDGLKIFEMPLLGFLGFPPFALECYAIYNFVGTLRRRIPWRLDDEDPGPRDPAPRWLGIPALGIAGLFCVTVMSGVEWAMVDSVRPGIDVVEDLVRLPPGALTALSIRTPDDLLCAGRTPDGRERLSQALGMSTEGLVAWLSAVELMRFKGLGEDRFLQLRQAGVFKISDLRRQNPIDLTRRMTDAFDRQTAPGPRPELRKTREWIRAARSARSRFQVD